MNILSAYRHCIICGSPLKVEGNIRKCLPCKKTFYVNPTPATGAIIINNNKILLTKRAEDPYKGTWDLPGGFVELNETLEESITREIFEELGVGTKSIKYFNSVVDKYLYHGVEDLLVVANFIVELDSYKIKPSDDVSEVNYFKFEEVPYDDIKFPSVINIIKEYISRNQS